MPDTDTVATESLAYTAMKADYWGQIEALRGGTEAMREEGTTFLPKHAKEEKGQWEYRKNRSFLYPAYDNAITQAASKPFSKPVSLTVELPERLGPMTDNMDLNGRNLTTFAKEVFDADMDYGMTHMLVDFPMTGGNLSAGDEAELKMRPSIVHYTPPSVFAWSTERAPNGQQVLAEVRISETRTEPYGTYGEVDVEYVRVIRPTEWELWRLNKATGGKGEWVQDGAGQNSLGFVPLVTYYTNRTGFMTARPPMWGLSDLNVQHWQVGSDYGNIVHIVMSPVLTIEGSSDDQVQAVTQSAGRLLVLPEGAKARYTESSGSGAAIGREELDRIEARMRALSMEPYIENSGTPTATGRAIDESKSQAAIQAWIRALENAMEDAFEVAGKWVKTELPDDFGVNVFNDFTMAMGSTSDAEAIRKDWQAGLISKPFAIQEMIRRGLYPEGTDIDKLIAETEEEGQPLAEMGLPPEVDEDDGETDDGDGEGGEV